MLPYILLSTQVAVVFIGVLLFSWWLHRRLQTRWSTWGWGALAFVSSQIVRIPLLLGLTLVLNPLFAGADPGLAFWVNVLILAGTSGLFEETARYVVLRWLARSDRSWRDAVMFGAGHGGVEALLIFGFSAISSLVLLATGDQLLAAARATNPEQATALAAQIDALRNLQPLGVVAGIWERGLAITLHISLSILVMRAVRERQLRWWAAAVVIHDLFNAAALIAMRYGGTAIAELVLTALTAISVAIILRSRPAAPEPASPGTLEAAPR